MTIARTLTNSFSGIRPGDAPAFIAAQLIGAVLATALMGWLLRPEAEPAEATERARLPARELG